METGSSSTLKSDINVTPLVDVMLVLLIIFMLITPMLQQGMSVSLPTAVNVAAVSDDPNQVVVVVVQQNGEIYLSQARIDRTQLESALRARHSTNPTLQLQIKADENVRFEEVRKLIRTGRAAGFDNAALVALELRDAAATGNGGR